MKYGPLLLLCLFVVLSGCDNSEPDDEPTGGQSFTATVTGSRSATFGGSALAVESHDTSISWGISLSDLTTGYKILIAWEAPTPAVGTYPLGDSNSATVMEGLLLLEGVLDQYGSTGGTFTVTSVTESRIAGSFTFTAVYGGLDAALAGTEVTVNGTFNSSNIIDDGS